MHKYTTEKILVALPQFWSSFSCNAHLPSTMLPSAIVTRSSAWKYIYIYMYTRVSNPQYANTHICAIMYIKYVYNPQLSEDKCGMNIRRRSITRFAAFAAPVHCAEVRKRTQWCCRANWTTPWHFYYPVDHTSQLGLPRPEAGPLW